MCLKNIKKVNWNGIKLFGVFLSEPTISHLFKSSSAKGNHGIQNVPDESSIIAQCLVCQHLIPQNVLLANTDDIWIFSIFFGFLWCKIMQMLDQLDKKKC